jgi:hypothetical protein
MGKQEGKRLKGKGTHPKKEEIFSLSPFPIAHCPIPLYVRH